MPTSRLSSPGSLPPPKPSRKPTRSLDAWDIYLQGMHEYNRHSIDGFLAGAELFGKSLEVDPMFALAAAGLASCWLMLAINGWRGEGIGAFRMRARSRAPALSRSHEVRWG